MKLKKFGFWFNISIKYQNPQVKRNNTRQTSRAQRSRWNQMIFKVTPNPNHSLKANRCYDFSFLPFRLRHQPKLYNHYSKRLIISVIKVTWTLNLELKIFAVYPQTLALGLSCCCQQQEGLSALVITYVKYMLTTPESAKTATAGKWSHLSFPNLQCTSGIHFSTT